MSAFPIANLSFSVLQFLGIYRPESITSKWSIFIYNIYSMLIIIIMYFHTSTFFVNICQNLNNVDLIIDNIIYFAPLFSISFKMTYIKIYRNDFIAFKDMFLDLKCIPRNSDEISIRIRFHKYDRLHSRLFMFATLSTSVLFCIIPLSRRTLIFKTWMPYDINSEFRFWMTELFQCLALILSSVLYPPIEVLAVIMMQQICAQLEMCMNRLMEISLLLKQNVTDKNDNYRQETELLEKCVTQHVYIYSSMVFVQFFTSTLCLCSVIYQLSKLSVVHFKFWSVVAELNVYLMQIFMYCIFGEIMIKKSLAVADTVYHMKWPTLTERTKKNLIIIMLRSNRPIILNGASMFTMSIDTFVKILKASFSMFNLLQSTA